MPVADAVRLDDAKFREVTTVVYCNERIGC